MTSLSARGLSVRFGSKLILDQTTFELPSRGVIALMGPGGAGKSTLLRTLAGLNDANPNISIEGDITYLGRPIQENHPALVVQKPDEMSLSLLRFMVPRIPCRSQMTPREQRETLQRFLEHAGIPAGPEQLQRNLLDFTSIERRDLLIVRETLTDPAVLLLDESADGFDDPSALLRRIASEGQKRCVLLVTHNQSIARRVADHVLLLAGGKIQESQPTDVFFEAPQSQAGHEWIRSGSCSVPGPNTTDEHLDPTWVIERAVSRLPRTKKPPTPPNLRPKTQGPASASQGPRGFRWVTPGRYGGTPQPGLLADADLDVNALCNVGTSVLVTLTEDPLPCQEACERAGISVLHVPIIDMRAPSVEAAAALCEQVRRLAEEGEIIVYHCKAGIGRTGTMLAAQLIWEGLGSHEAMKHVRAAEPKYIQSTHQEDFLVRFAREVGSDRVDLEAAAESKGL